MHAVQTEQHVTTRAGISGWARFGAPRSVGHVEVLEFRRAAWSLLILGDLDPYPALNPPNLSLPTATAKSRIAFHGTTRWTRHSAMRRSIRSGCSRSLFHIVCVMRSQSMKP